MPILGMSTRTEKEQAAVIAEKDARLAELEARIKEFDLCLILG